MYRWIIRAALALLVAAAGAALVSPARADESSAARYYVALGDSLAEGYQPNGEVGHGYADQLYAMLKAGDPRLQLENLACGGETTSSMISGVMPWGGLGSRYFCGYRARSAQLAHGSQLADAIAFLRAHRRFVSLITIDIGGNDVADCVAMLDQACLDAGLVEVRANLQSIVAALRDAAGPDVPIVAMTYYDPLSVLWFDSPAAGRKADDLVQIVNTTLDEIYTARGVPVAQVDDAFAVGTFPDSAANACGWTWMCTASPDIHPTRTVFGAVNGNGTSQFSTDDFSVERLGPGHYKLTFAPGTFAQPPGLVVMPIGPSFVGGMSGTDGTPQTGWVVTYVLADIASGQLTDRLHTFIATPVTQG